MPHREISKKERLIASINRAHAIATADKFYTYSIDEMSAIIGVSPTWFKVWFKRLYKKPFTDYCRHCKMHEAKLMLMSGNYAFISDIWRLFGYCKHETFIQAYKLVHGNHPNKDFLPSVEVHADKLELIHNSRKMLTIEMAAKLTDMSKSFVKSAFKKKYGITIGKHFAVKQGQNIKVQKTKKRYVSA